MCLAAAALGAYASVSVEDGTQSVRRQKPEMIYVASFSTARGDFAVDRTGHELAAFKSNLQLMLRTGIAAEITDKLMPAFAESAAHPPATSHAWLVHGQFVTVIQGSRLLRSTIGFGAGRTKLETRVQVYDLAEDPGEPFLTFSTTGGSGAEPGAVLAIAEDPLQLAVSGGLRRRARADRRHRANRARDHRGALQRPVPARQDSGERADRAEAAARHRYLVEP
ncbi:MAG: DUF4410 domain-containing protein [Verrucomicrobiota bacterium]